MGKELYEFFCGGIYKEIPEGRQVPQLFNRYRYRLYRRHVQ